MQRMNAIRAYIPQDRQQALIDSRHLPEITHGAALFADISGFTRLTEDFRQAFGARLGAEKLGQQLNLVYDALIAEVDRFQGSVLGFSGDAITCWFGQPDSTGAGISDQTALSSAEFRAATCAFALHRSLSQVKIEATPGNEQRSLLVKVAIASGDAHRYLVGDPNIQVIDAAAGEVLLRMANAESLADKGEVVVDEATANILGEHLQIREWRSSALNPEQRFAVAANLTQLAPPSPWPFMLNEQEPSLEQARPWLLPVIYDRLVKDVGEFLTELRPAIALFLRFGGIDFDTDPLAGNMLNQYITWVQSVVARYNGALIQLTIGEKGSYLYIAFGAPVAHEDDAWRAASTALELRNPPEELSYIQPIQIGISRGMMRTGSYGSSNRRTYGVLGDDVNLAARLMQISPHGQILVSEPVRKTLEQSYSFQPLPPVQLKGKRQPAPVAILLDRSQGNPETMPFSGALIGRQNEIVSMIQAIVPIFSSPGRFAGLISVDGEAGMGKSRIIYELNQRLHSIRQAFQWSTCPVDPVQRQSFSPFRHFLRQYFKQNANATDEINRLSFDGVLDNLLERLDQRANSDLRCVLLKSQLQRTRSILGAMIDLHWSGSLYENLEPKLRFENTLLAFKALILAEALQQPVVLHIEEAHCLDKDSQAMLGNLTRGISDMPLVILLSGRYCDDKDPDCFSMCLDSPMPQLQIRLGGLSPAEVTELAAQILPQGVSSAPPGSALVRFLIEKTDGNPLFIEQLILELHESEMLQVKNGAWQLSTQGDDRLPTSINAVMIARLDRLEERLRTVVQTASVLGVEFEVPVLARMLPDDDQLAERVQDAQERGVWLPVDRIIEQSGMALKRARYGFRQTLMRESAYEMQPQSHLQQLHRRAAMATENLHENEIGGYYADLAFHYDLARDDRQAFKFSILAGKRAASEYANEQAVASFKRALKLSEALPPAETLAARLDVLLSLGELLVSTGRYQADDTYLEQALELAKQAGDKAAQAQACRWLARFSEMHSDYNTSLEWVGRGLKALGNLATLDTCNLLAHAGLVHSRLGNPEAAQANAELCLKIALSLGEARTLGRAYNLLGHLARLTGESATAIEYLQRSVEHHTQAGDILNQALAHNQLANALLGVSRWSDAKFQYSQARQTFEQIGDTYHRIFTDNNLGSLALNQGQFEQALEYFFSGLKDAEQISGSLWVLGGFHNNIGAAYIRGGNFTQALQHLDRSLDYFEQAGARDWLPELNRHKAEAWLKLGDLHQAQQHAVIALDLARQLQQSSEEAQSLRTLGEISLARADLNSAQQYLEHSLVLLAGKDAFEHARTLLALARLQAAQDEKEQMQQTLAASIATFETLGAELDLAEAQKLLK
jgi:class 3 adenylate cyclase/predicted ATPase